MVTQGHTLLVPINVIFNNERTFVTDYVSTLNEQTAFIFIQHILIDVTAHMFKVLHGLIINYSSISDLNVPVA